MDKKDILEQCSVDGNIVRLPAIQLDRDLYLEVKKALELIGGKWKSGKTQGFVFKEDPSEYLSKLCNGEDINLKKEFQFFATPDTIADRLVELADTIIPEMQILEPSAGQGAIIKAIHKVNPDVVVDCFELMELNRTFLEKLDNINIIGNDFISEKKDKLYDLIIANPPFSKNQDIQHVHEMWNCLKDDGRLISIMSNHWRFTSGKKEKAFQHFINEVGASVYDLEPGDFKESGTNIQACIVIIDKQHSDNIKQILGAIGSYEKKESKKKEKGSVIPMSESKKAEKEFADMFNSFVYRFSNSEVFNDFLDYCLVVFKWWDPNRDFSYWEDKYKELYPKFLEMFNLLGIASENGGVGFHDALGDLFMELVSHGRNGQFFTPDNITDMIAQCLNIKIEDGQNILDPACGSFRMLLSAAKENRKANFFGCDNDIACCKMSVINLLLNSITGEIAWMDSLKMEYHKSWFCYTVNLHGINYPIYDIIEDKEISPLWKRHIDTFERNIATRETDNVIVEESSTQPITTEQPTKKSRIKKEITAQLCLEF